MNKKSSDHIHSTIVIVLDVFDILYHLLSLVIAFIDGCLTEDVEVGVCIFENRDKSVSIVDNCVVIFDLIDFEVFC